MTVSAVGTRRNAIRVVRSNEEQYPVTDEDSRCGEPGPAQANSV